MSKLLLNNTFKLNQRYTSIISNVLKTELSCPF